MGRLLDIAATLLSIGAGVYLLGKGSSQIDLGTGVQGQSWFEVIAHGMGAYFVAKGVWMARSLHLQGELADAARRQAEFAAHEHVARTAAAPDRD